MQAEGRPMTKEEIIENIDILNKLVENLKKDLETFSESKFFLKIHFDKTNSSFVKRTDSGLTINNVYSNVNMIEAHYTDTMNELLMVSRMMLESKTRGIIERYKEKIKFLESELKALL